MYRYFLVAAVYLMAYPIHADETAVPRNSNGPPAGIALHPVVDGSSKAVMLELASENKEGKEIGLGRGYNSLSGEYQGECISGKISAPNDQDYKTEYSLTQIRTSEEFRRSLQLSASASMGVGIWKGDASSNFFHSLDRNRYYDYLLVNVSVSGPTYSLRSVKLSDEGTKVKPKPKDFYTRCGNQYLRSVTVGGQFLAVVTIETNTEAERQDLQAALSAAAIGYGSGQAKFAENLSNSTKNYKRTISILRKGTADSVPDLTIESIIKYSMDFPTKINKKTGYPISFEHSYYTDVDVNVPRYMREEILADDWATRAGDLYSDYADLLFYQNHKEILNFYPPLSDEQIASGIRNLSSVVDNIKLQYVSCLEEPASACSIMVFPKVDVTLPRRSQQAGLDPKQGAAQFIGVVGAGETKTLSVLGEWSAWSDGENLWWPPERCCFSVVVSPAFGQTYEKSYGGPIQIEGPSRVSVKIGDGTYSDNRARNLVGILF